MARPTTSSTDRLAEEYRALRDAAAVVDLAAWTVLEILGAETRSFLQGVATQDFETPPPVGSAVCTLFLTEKGRAAAHAWVTFGEGKDPVTAWILSDPGCREDLRTHLERYRVMEDVEFRGPEGTPRLLGIIGPERDPLAGAIVSSIRGASAVHAESISFVLAPPDTDPKALPPTVDPRAFDAWRIRIGLPYRGIDFGDDRIATELALPDAISMTKGC